MRYFFIDRIERLEFNKQILATKNVTLSEDVFTDHFFAYPVMPGALLIECLAQAGTALIEVSRHFEKKALLIMVDRAKFRALVRPGDRLAIQMDVAASDEESVQMAGTIHNEGKLVVTALLTFATRDADEFYPPKVKALMETIYDVWLAKTELIGFPGAPE